MSGIKFEPSSRGITMRLIDDDGRWSAVDLTVPEFTELVRCGSRIAGLPEPWRRR